MRAPAAASGLANKAIRIVDPDAMRRAKLLNRWCVACLHEGANSHHVLSKGSPYHGDDVIQNLLTVCGSGTMRCHGAIHGSPYVVTVPTYLNDGMSKERRDAEWVNRRIGKHLLEQRWDVIDYVLKKLGAVAGADYLLRKHYITV